MEPPFPCPKCGTLAKNEGASYGIPLVYHNLCEKCSYRFDVQDTDDGIKVLTDEEHWERMRRRTDLDVIREAYQTVGIPHVIRCKDHEPHICYLFVTPEIQDGYLKGNIDMLCRLHRHFVFVEGRYRP